MARAYSHFVLVNLFGKHYNTSTSSTDLGVPYMTAPEVTLNPQYTRNTVAEVYAAIDKDLAEGLPSSRIATTSRRPTTSTRLLPKRSPLASTSTMSSGTRRSSTLRRRWTGRRPAAGQTSRSPASSELRRRMPTQSSSPVRRSRRTSSYNPSPPMRSSTSPTLS